MSESSQEHPDYDDDLNDPDDNTTGYESPAEDDLPEESEVDEDDFDDSDPEEEG